MPYTTLISVQKRVQTALIIESGEIREVMHAALLLGYGASAINPIWLLPYWTIWSSGMKYR